MQWMRLAAGSDEEKKTLAARCLQRYVHPSIAPQNTTWADWYRKYTDRIVFIESTGFWWQEDPRVLEREKASSTGG